MTIFRRTINMHSGYFPHNRYHNSIPVQKDKNSAKSRGRILVVLAVCGNMDQKAIGYFKGKVSTTGKILFSRHAPQSHFYIESEGYFSPPRICRMKVTSKKFHLSSDSPVLAGRGNCRNGRS
jgi:hypothetical protein